MNIQTIKAIQNQHQNILELILNKRLKEALAELESFMGELSNWTLQNRLEQAQNAYSNMLKYMLQGAEDPQRNTLYMGLLRECYELADQICVNKLDEVLNTNYHTEHRRHKNMVLGVHMCDWLRRLEGFKDDLAVCQLMPDNKQSLKEVLEKHENTNKSLFLATWGNAAWSREDALNAKQFLASQDISSNDLSYFISAVTLSVLECFDALKLAFLLTAVTLKDVQATQRALVGVALTLLNYPDRLPVYPELQARLDLLDEKWNLGAKLNIIYLQLIRAQETEKVNKRINEEIIPEMMKQADKFKNKKLNLEELMEENDFNPDWEKEFNDSKLNEKIYEMSELQMEGVDVNMSTFSHLKKYPFFYEFANWLLPFDLNHSSIVNLPGFKDGKIDPIRFLLKSPILCDSDKYSICFLLSSIPDAQKEVMLSNMGHGELKELMESEQVNRLNENAEEPKQISNRYIQDLYRFYNINPYKHELYNPFSRKIHMHRIPALKKILNKPELLKEVANYRFRKEQYMEAWDIYESLTEQNEADADIYQKYGYCLQKMGHYALAIDAFRKADILKPDNLWNLRHLATCYRHTQQLEKALECYRKVEEMQPDNKTILFQMGICLGSLEQYDAALQLFFKLDYLENNNTKAWRAIGWYSLVNGKIEQAQRYLLKVLDFQPTTSDYLNAGHAAWIQKQLEKAVGYYKEAAALYNNRDAFLKQFEKDKDILLQQGISEDDIPLVLDLI